jgi:hypothetical protein
MIKAIKKMDKKDKKNSAKNDKIFGNDFNTGNVEFEFFGKIKIKDEWNPESEEFTDNSYEGWERQQLREELYNIFDESSFREKYSKIKKVPKTEMVRIYYHFSDKVSKDKYSSVQVFTEIAEFMKMNYKEMFHQLLPVDKQRIVQELNDEFNVLDKRNIKRLF